MLDSLTKSKELWDSINSYWSLVKNQGFIDYIWQGMIETTQDIYNRKSMIEAYSPEVSSNYYETVWDRFTVATTTLDDDIISIPTLQDGINSYSNIYEEGVEYTIDSHEINWVGSAPNHTYLWAPTVKRENVLISTFNDDFFGLQLSSGYSPSEQQYLINMFWTIAKRGGLTTHYIDAILTGLSGLPVAYYPGRVKDVGTSITIEHLIQTNILRYNDTNLVYGSKITDEITIINNSFESSETYSVGDVIYIGNAYYHVGRVSETNYIIYENIEDVTDSATVYLKLDVPEEYYNNCCVLDQDQNVYPFINGNVSSMPTGDYTSIFVGHRQIIKEHLNGDSTIYSYTTITTIPTPTVQVTSGDYVVAFTPLQTYFTTYSWGDITSDATSEDVEEKLDQLSAKYLNEAGYNYAILEDLDGTILTVAKNGESYIVADDHLHIQQMNTDSEQVDSLSGSGQTWTVVVPDPNSVVFRKKDTVILYQPYTSDTGLNVHRKQICYIVDGEYNYETQKYTLTIRGALDAIYSSIGDDDRPYIAKQSIAHNISKIDSASDGEVGEYKIMLDSKNVAPLSNLPIIKKAKYGNYGDSVVDLIDSISGDEIIVDTTDDISGDVYQYVIIKDSSYPATIYQITGIAHFVLSNWNFSGVNALDGEENNATADTPFPLGTYKTSAPTSLDMIITGMVDGTLTGGIPKAIEFYVLKDIPDLSIYGFGSANNGGGSNGEEWSFPADSVTAGTYIYIASESVSFNTFFGFDPDYVSDVINVNGDDATELFKNGQVIDTFGDVNVDGTGQPWEYTDGWAYRIDNTVPYPMVTVDRNVEYSYTSDASAVIIFIKTLPDHNKILIIPDMDQSSEDRAVIESNILNNQPHYISNIDSVLNKILPAGYSHKWG